MKKLPYLFSLLLLIGCQIGFAQGEVELEEIQPETPLATEFDTAMVETEMDLFREANIFETSESMSKGLQNAIVVEVDATDTKLVSKVWKDFMKDYGGKTKKSKGGKRGEQTTSGAEIIGINGVTPMTVYSANAAGSEGNVEHTVWFDLGEEYLASEHGSQYREAEAMLQNFAHEVKVQRTRIELKDAEKKLKGMEGDLKQLVRQNEGYHKDIKNYEKKIEEAKENIITNDEQQVDTNQRIGLQKELRGEIERRLKALRNH